MASARALRRPRALSAAPLALALALAALAALALPDQAHALAVTDAVNSWLCDLVRAMVKSSLNSITSSAEELIGTVKAIGSGDGLAATGFTLGLTNGLNDLFGGGEGASAVYTLAKDVMNGFGKPLAGVVLVACMCMQMVKVSQHMNASAALPGVMEVGGLLVFFVFFDVMIDRAEEVLQLIFSLGQLALRTIVEKTTAEGGAIDTAGLDALTDLPSLIMVLVNTVVVAIFMLIANVAGLFCVWGRALQIYVMMMFAPIPIALLGGQDTRQMGIGFLKNFAALCLSAAVMAFSLVLFGVLLTDVMVEYSALPLEAGGGATIKMIALCLLLISALVKSGSWAREVFGG